VFYDAGRRGIEPHYVPPLVDGARPMALAIKVRT